MATKLDDLYGTNGGTPPQTDVNGTGARDLSVRATPEAFGAGVGEAVAKAGDTAQGLIQQYQNIYTEAKANDTYANFYVPAAAKARSEYDQLPASAKISGGYDTYISNLQQIGQEATNMQPSLVGQKMVESQVGRHRASEVDSTSRENTQNLLAYSDQAGLDKVIAGTNDAVQNYADAAARAKGYSILEGHATIMAMNQGADPTTSDGKAKINDTTDAQQGALACKFVDQAIKNNNLPVAFDVKREAGLKIPPAQYSQIDKNLDALSLDQHATQSATAIVQGKPIPNAIGVPVPELRAMAVNNADTHGIDPNLSLATMLIESSNGTNLGTKSRQSIGQDQESVGKSPADQIDTMNKNLKEADGYAKNRFGGIAQPWHSYAYYQQGKPRADALFQADAGGMNDNVLDVLQNVHGADGKPIGRQAAMEDVVGNHGDIRGTASDFLNSIQDVYARKSKLSSVDMMRMTPVSLPAPYQNFTFNGAVNQEITSAAQVAPTGGSAQAITQKSSPSSTEDDGLKKPSKYWLNDYLDASYDPVDEKSTNTSTQKFAPAIDPKNQPAVDAATKVIQAGGSQEDSYKAFVNAGGKINGGKQIPQGVPIPAEQALGGSSAPEAKTNAAHMSDAIMAPHTATSPPVLPGATPLQDLQNWNSRVPVMVDRINQITDPVRRQAIQEKWNKMDADYKRRAEAYSSDIISQSHQLASDPKFTDINQMTPDMFTVATDRPAIMNYMQKMADENADKALGVTGKGAKEWGRNFLDVNKKLADGTIDTPTKLMEHVMSDDITPAGFDKLYAQNFGKEASNTPESKSDEFMRNSLLKDLEAKYVMGPNDSEGREKLNAVLPTVFNALDNRDKNNLTMGQLTDPNDPHYVGNLIKGIRSPVQTAISAINNTGMTNDDLWRQLKRTTFPVERARLIKEAEDRGLIQKSADAEPDPYKPIAPVSQ